jgi:hypothetical protein
VRRFGLIRGPLGPRPARLACGQKALQNKGVSNSTIRRPRVTDFATRVCKNSHTSKTPYEITLFIAVPTCMLHVPCIQCLVPTMGFAEGYFVRVCKRPVRPISGVLVRRRRPQAIGRTGDEKVLNSRFALRTSIRTHKMSERKGFGVA